MSLKGGNPASLTATEVSLAKTSNTESGCTTGAATFSATYSVDAPKPLYVSPPKPWTTLCKTQEPLCETANLYPSATALTASSTNAAIALLAAGVPAQIACTESSFTAATTSQGSAPLPASVSAWTLGGCKETFAGTSCTATTEALPYGGAISHSAGSDGIFAIGTGGTGQPGWRVKCPAVNHDCTYRFEPNMSLKGGNPATLTAATIPLTKTSNTEWGCTAGPSTFSATYNVSAPKPLYVLLK
jgi:hypothetical protein